MKNVMELTENTFKAEVLQASTPVLVDFYAPWCGPCKMLAPLLEQMAAEYQGRIKFCKLNVDEAPGLAGEYNVTGVPTLFVFAGGRVIDSLVGLASPKGLKALLDGAVASPQPAAAAPKL